jgi:hypothetical protein
MSAKEPVVAREAAEEEFDRWVEAMGLAPKLDPVSLDDEDKKALASQKNLILHAIMDGRLVVNGEGEFVYTPAIGVREPLTFHEPTGGSLMASDHVATGKPVTKQFRALADITKTTTERFRLMKNRDLEVCNAIIALFLAT